MKKTSRNKKGNLLVLLLVVICLLIIPLILLQSHIGLATIDREKTRSIVEAGCLQAANEISRVIIEDPHFGYVSLSNYPPVGKGTCALDGEPLPVVSINNLVATIRQNSIVARELGNNTMIALADEDKRYLDSTVWKLNAALRDALSEKPRKQWKDIHGNNVEPYKTTYEFLRKSLPPGYEIDSFRLSNGWLENSGSSSTDIPVPARFSHVESKHIQNGQYKPFIDIDFAGQTYTFAGVGKTSAIVNPALYRKPEREKSRLCSIVKLECRIEPRKMNTPLGVGQSKAKSAPYTACCQPYSIPDAGPKGIMTLRFNNGSVWGMQSWSDLLSESTFRDRRVSIFKAVKGDYPVDPGSRMRKITRRMRESTAQQFAEHLYYWLRNGNSRPRVDSILEMVSESFKEGPGAIYAYEFMKDGRISRRILLKDPFPAGVTAEGQVSSTADTQVQGGISPVVIFRNNVRYLGNSYGGKHAGQPIAGTPLNWCELGEYGGDEHIAEQLGKGKNVTKLIIDEPESSQLTLESAGRSIFRQLDGKNLALQPRRNYYSGGLAVDIEIGGTRIVDSSKTVALMRALSR